MVIRTAGRDDESVDVFIFILPPFEFSGAGRWD